MESNHDVQLELIQGPREKGSATIYFERLIKDILFAWQNNQGFKIAYNRITPIFENTPQEPTGEMTIEVNNHFYNLTQLLIAKPDLEQLSFDDQDLETLNKMLNDSETAYGRKDVSRLDEKLKRAKIYFPHLSEAEIISIHNQTTALYTLINYLLRYNAAVQFPYKKIQEYNDSGEFPTALRKFYDGYGYDPIDTPVESASHQNYLTRLVREVLLNVAFIGFALSKNLQSQPTIYLASNEVELENNIHSISGLGLVIVGMGEKRTIYLVGYGEKNKTKEPIPIMELLNNSGQFDKSEDLIRIEDKLNNPQPFTNLNDLGELMMTKMTNALRSHEQIDALFFENVYRVDKINDAFKDYLFKIEQGIEENKQYSLNVSGFYSTSNEPIEYFKKGADAIAITEIKNPIGYAKLIDCISAAQGNEKEYERLYVHGQQMVFNKIETDDKQNVYLHGAPARSIDDIYHNAYSHQITLIREATIMLNDKIDTFIQQQTNPQNMEYFKQCL